MQDLFSPRAHYQTFGFVVLRSALSRYDVTRLAREADRVVRDATGDRYLVDDGQGGITGHYIPATGDRTPMSLELLRRFAPLAEDLAGVPLLPAVAQHTLFFDMAGWHTDTGHAIPSIKVVAYLEELDERNGALRVLSGSHRLDERVLTDLLHGPTFRDEARAREATRRVPAHVITSRPGDVIVFDEHLWHASIGGRHRHQWSTTYVLDPTTPEERHAVRTYLASQFSDDMQLDYDPTHYPYYGAPFRTACQPRWAAQLDSLGAFDAAAAEQRQSHNSPGADYRRSSASRAARPCSHIGHVSPTGQS